MYKKIYIIFATQIQTFWRPYNPLLFFMYFDIRLELKFLTVFNSYSYEVFCHSNHMLAILTSNNRYWLVLTHILNMNLRMNRMHNEQYF